MDKWQGKKVLVIGAARQGLSAARFLASHHVQVILNDQRPATAFSHINQELRSLEIETRFGGHPIDLLSGVDLLCISGGVPLDNPLVLEARKLGIPITNDSQIFFETVDTQVIGITGSAGKTTTTILLGEIAKQAVSSKQKVWVGGNIGYPMLDHAGEIQKDDWVILELSSFQLELMSASPSIAVILNLTPNHLDRHKSMENYIAAKARILHFQKKDHFAILNREDPHYLNILNQVKGKVITFGFNKPTDQHNGVFVNNGSVIYKDEKDEKIILGLDCLHLPGLHNRMNLLATCAASCAAGFSSQAVHDGTDRVRNIPHRLELVRELGGVRWVNDSIATTPERVIAALHSIQTPLIILLGGRDKDLPWEELAVSLHQFKPRVILFGEAAGMIYSVLRKIEAEEFSYCIYTVSDLEEAVQLAHHISKPGDTVLLSPGGTSFDAYEDFEKRGNHFRKMVEAFE